MGDIRVELDRLYREKCNGMDTLVRFTPLELEHLNNLIGIGMRERSRSLKRVARKEHRKLSEWGKHLLELDNSLLDKIIKAEDIAFTGKLCLKDVASVLDRADRRTVTDMIQDLEQE